MVVLFIEQGNITANALHQILKKYISSSSICFSIDKCQLLISMYDDRKDGFISAEQLRAMCADINQFNSIYCQQLVNADGCLRYDQIKKCFEEMGCNLNPFIIRIILNRYGTPANEHQSQPGQVGKAKADNNEDNNRCIDFCNFIACSLKLRNEL